MFFLLISILCQNINISHTNPSPTTFNQFYSLHRVFHIQYDLANIVISYSYLVFFTFLYLFLVFIALINKTTNQPGVETIA